MSCRGSVGGVWSSQWSPGQTKVIIGEASRLKNKQQQRDNIIKLDAHGSQQKLSVEVQQSATAPICIFSP